MRTIAETPNLRWFKPYPACRMCGKKSDGLLYDSRNESYGDHCKKCADERLALSKKVREEESAAQKAEDENWQKALANKADLDRLERAAGNVTRTRCWSRQLRIEGPE